jgi:endonuclease YncB( thermonuclease family)
MIHSISAEYSRTNWHPPFLLGLIAAMLLTVILFVARAGAQSPPRPVADPAFAAAVCPPRGLTVDAAVVRVIDGDTIVVRTSIEYQVRLLDCWTPESRTKDLQEKQRGLKAKARMLELAAAGTPVRVHVPNGSSDLTEAITMGRLLGRVWPVQNGLPAAEDLSVTTIREGFATAQKVKVQK